jgi:hypothetical protein
MLQVRFCSGILGSEKLINHVIPLQQRADIAAALDCGDVRLVSETASPDHHIPTKAWLKCRPVIPACWLRLKPTAK